MHAKLNNTDSEKHKQNSLKNEILYIIYGYKNQQDNVKFSVLFLVNCNLLVQVPNLYNQKDELKSRLLTQTSRYLFESCHQILVKADYLEIGHKNMNKTFQQHHQMNQLNL